MIKYIETKCREGDRKYNRLCTKDKVPGYIKPEILKILLDEYADIQRKLHESLQNQDMEEYYTDMVSFITKVSNYIFRDSEKTKKGLEKTMGGEVLELESEKLIRKGRQQALVWKQSER